MATYTTITDPQVAAGAALNTALMTALRENPIAIAERASGAPKVQTDFQFIATADALNDATIDFTGFDATAYDAYIFVLQNVRPSGASGNLLLRTSSDGGVSYDSTAGNYGTNGTATTTSIEFAAGVGGDANEYGANGTLLITSANIAQRTSAYFSGGFVDNGGALFVQSKIGQRNEDAIVDAVRFLISAGTIESGTITMYGVRNG